MAGLKPFWCYYGGKWRAAPRYPKPARDTIIEPFAGAAGYSMRYPDRNVVLVESYPVVAEMWRYLISVTPGEVRRLPIVEHVDDLPDWVPDGARHLIGFRLNSATVSPRRQLSAGVRRLRDSGRSNQCWGPGIRERVAAQVDFIRHWEVIEGDYTEAPDVEATWFVDPPYNNRAGSYYIHSSLDYESLGKWCMSRQGQVIVCENEGADWLPFEPFATLKAGVNGRGSKEVIWLGGEGVPS